MGQADEKTRSTSELLATPIQYVKGVGPRRAELYTRLGLTTVRDLLFFFPRDYHDLTDLRAPSKLEEGKPLSVRGTIEEIDLRNVAPGRSVLGMLIRQGDDFLRAVWFNQAYLSEKFRCGQHVLLFGKARLRAGRWEMTHPRVDLLDSDEDLPPTKFQPIYCLTEGLHQHEIRRAIHNAVDAYAHQLDEVFPDSRLAEYQLAPIHEALAEIHSPSGKAALDRARRRFVFQELFILQLALSLRRRQRTELRQAPPLERTAKIDARIRRLLPFELTAGQEQALAEITADMARDHPMNRLLQGDVGSGKTLVAVYAMMLAVAHGHQAALMAPTELLAQQHFDVLSRILAASHVRLGLLTGGLTTRQRKVMLDAIAAGEIDLVIGTQAIVQSGVDFARLALVVIDEQHKFGVRQRAALKHSGADPHYLVMTATPIPRSVSMTMFGDLDVSSLHDRPPGRQKVHTYLIDPERSAQWWEFVCKKLGEGRQAYVVAPLVEDSEQLELESAEHAFEQLANGQLEAFRLDLVHGRMNAGEKDAAMQAFRSGRTQVLVSTSVVEVGVDVPGATVMTIQGAERFGLAQLHQLRGRVSRGRFPGYCGIEADPQTDESRRRLEAFVETDDGFRLAEIDFELRGPGDLLGTKQHGLPPLRIADLVRDADVLTEARREAQRLVSDDPDLARPEHIRLRRMVFARYGQALELGDVG